MDNRLGFNFAQRSQLDLQESLKRSKHASGFGSSIGPPPERRSTISSVHKGGYPMNNSTNRMRNLSGGSVGSTASGSSTGSCSNLTDNQFSTSNSNFSHFSLDTFANNSCLPAAIHMNTSSTVPTNNSFCTSSYPGFSSPPLSSSSMSSPSSSTQHRTKSGRPERVGCGSSNNHVISDDDSNFGSYNNNSSNSTEHSSSISSGSSQQQQHQSHRSVNSSRYKTELCRPFEESGSCKYGDKCQFAHGMQELRNLSRHPKYKTELCRTFHTIGYCPYGPRCHFIHEEETGKVAPPDPISPRLNRSGSLHSSGSSSPSLSPSSCMGDGVTNIFSYQQGEPRQQQDNRQFNSLTVNINYNDSNSFDLLDKQLGLLSIGNNNKDETRDIFSQVTMFNENELLDNASVNTTSSSMGSRSQQLDNFPMFSEKPYWQLALCSGEDLLSSMLTKMGTSGSEGQHHSPTGSSADGISSSGSDSGSSGGSDCGGSTENLTFSEWRFPVAFGQY